MIKDIMGVDKVTFEKELAGQLVEQNFIYMVVFRMNFEE